MAINHPSQFKSRQEFEANMKCCSSIRAGDVVIISSISRCGNIALERKARVLSTSSRFSEVFCIDVPLLAIIVEFKPYNSYDCAIDSKIIKIIKQFGQNK